MHYLVALDAGSGSGPYAVAVPDLPGCFCEGASLEDALAKAERAIVDWIASAIDGGWTIPSPSSIAQLRRRHRGWRDRTWVTVRIDPSALDAAPLRVHLLLPRRVLARLDAQARSAGETRSAYVARLAIEGAAVR